MRREEGRVGEGLSTLTVEAVFEAHAEFVWQSLHRLGIAACDVDDALQEVFLVVHRRLAEFDPRTNVSITTWLYGICRYLALRHRHSFWRRRSRQGALDDVDNEALVAGDPSPQRVLEDREEHDWLASLLERLDPDRRVVFVMFEVEEISTAKIAELLGIPHGTVHSRLSSARKLLLQAAKRDESRRRFEESS